MLSKCLSEKSSTRICKFWLIFKQLKTIVLFFFSNVALIPQQAVKRYKKALFEFRRGKNLRSSYTAFGLDRSTVVASSAIAELAIVSWAKYEELLHGHSRGQRLKIFIKKCSDALTIDPTLLSEIEHLKRLESFSP